MFFFVLESDAVFEKRSAQWILICSNEINELIRQIFEWKNNSFIGDQRIPMLQECKLSIFDPNL